MPEMIESGEVPLTTPKLESNAVFDLLKESKEPLTLTAILKQSGGFAPEIKLTLAHLINTGLVVWQHHPRTGTLYRKKS